MSFVDPAPGATQGRTDQGVDWSGVTRLVAVAKGTITNVYAGLSGFGTTIVERVKGNYIYYAEESSGVSTQVHPGQSVAQGQQIAGGGSGGGIEAGIWDPSTGRALAAPGYHEGDVTAAGQRFASMIGKGNPNANWQPCVLTWYDPALGGINTTGGANPHAATASGQPYSDTANTCAAPPQYPFGTVVTFRYNGKTVTCTVNDRGGAIVGSHFDLARHPAEVLGIVNSGMVTAQFVVGTASGAGGSGFGGSRPGGGNIAAVDDLFASYTGLRDAPRTAPPQPAASIGAGLSGLGSSVQWWFAQFQAAAMKVFGG